MASGTRWATQVANVVVLAASLGAAHAAAQELDTADVGRTAGGSARAMGMGGAFVAISEDATAISWNPAAPGTLEKPELSVGYDPSTRIEWSHPARSDTSFRYTAYTEKTTSRLFDHLSFAAPLKVGSLKVTAQAGYWRALDLGLDRDLSYTYGALSADDFLNSFAHKSSAAGGIDVWSAGAGLRVSRAVSFGVALDYWHGEGRSSWAEEDTAGPSHLVYTGSLDQSLSGLGARVALALSPVEKLRFGAVLRIPTKLDLEHTMNARLEGETHAVDEQLDKSGKVDWPLAATLGLAYRPVPGLTIAADAALAQWSQAEWSSQYTFITTTTPATVGGRVETRGERRQLWPTLQDPASVDSKVKQADSLQMRVGVEYAIRARPGLSFPIRLGGFSDRQMTRDANGDPVRCLGLTAGLGVATAHVSLDAAFAHESGESSIEGATDKLKRTAQRFYISATFRP
jgi:long-subunit fatty acid transport protein